LDLYEGRRVLNADDRGKAPSLRREVLPSLRDLVPIFWGLPRTYVRGYCMPLLTGCGGYFCVFAIKQVGDCGEYPPGAEAPAFDLQLCAALKRRSSTGLSWFVGGGTRRGSIQCDPRRLKPFPVCPFTAQLKPRPFKDGADTPRNAPTQAKRWLEWATHRVGDCSAYPGAEARRYLGAARGAEAQVLPQVVHGGLCPLDSRGRLSPHEPWTAGGRLSPHEAQVSGSGCLSHVALQNQNQRRRTRASALRRQRSHSGRRGNLGSTLTN
jgi:hypothetical protein